MNKSNNHLLLLLILTCLSILNTGCSKKHSFEVKSLTCEYLINPVGIDINQPRLSWRTSVLEKGMSFNQDAWQIVASTSQEKLERGEYDAWNSGKVKSKEQHLISWEGRPLKFADRIYWKVKVWDIQGRESDWSTPAWFNIGPLNTEDWKGDWIRYPYASPEEKYTAINFKRSFNIKNELKNAIVYIAVDGVHELSINGKKADNRVLSPVLSAPSRLRYVGYYISKYLTKGENSVEVELCTGSLMFNDPEAEEYPVFLFQLTVDGEILFTSDNQWLCSKGNRSIYHQDDIVGKNGGELSKYGGELVQSVVPEIWKSVAISNAPKKIISAEMLEPDEVHAILEPISINKTEYNNDDAWRIDFGKNFTGFLDFEMAGKPGSSAYILSSDRKEEFQTYGQVSKLILNESGKGRFNHKFNFCAGRYVTIVGDIKQPLHNEFRALAVTTKRKAIGKFASSNQLLNKIFETDRWTYLANTINGYTMDCPHRERRGYGAEGAMASIFCALPLYQSGPTINKWLQDWQDVQEPNGKYPHCAPRDNLGGGPWYSAAPVHLSYYTYTFLNDKKLLEENYEGLHKWMEFLHSKVENGILTNYEPQGYGWRGLGDWTRPHPGAPPKKGVPLSEIGKSAEAWGSSAALHFNNCFYAWNLKLMTYIARQLGKTKDETEYSRRFLDLKKHIHEKFYNPEKHVYIDSDQMRQAFPLLVGIPADSVRGDILKSLLMDITSQHPYFDTGNSTPLLVDILSQKLNRDDLILEILLRDSYPGYAYLLKNGATTWPEFWDFAQSQIHTSYTGISSWFIQGLGGIRPNDKYPGFQKFIIKPYFAKEIDWVCTSYESPYGDIISEWRKIDENINLTIQVPPNSSAKLILPFSLNKINLFSTSEKNIELISQPTLSGSEFNIDSGKYTFNISNY